MTGTAAWSGVPFPVAAGDAVAFAIAVRSKEPIGSCGLTSESVATVAGGTFPGDEDDLEAFAPVRMLLLFLSGVLDTRLLSLSARLVPSFLPVLDGVFIALGGIAEPVVEMSFLAPRTLSASDSGG